jgi:hypothetical protein
MSEKYSGACFQLFCQNGHLINEKFGSFLAVSSDYASRAIYNRKYQIADEVADLITRYYHNLKPLLKGRYYFRYLVEFSMLKIIISEKTGHFKEGLFRMEEVERQMEASGKKRNHAEDINWMLHKAILLLGDGRYNESLHSLNRLVNARNSSRFNDLYVVASILRLWLLIEIKDFTTIVYKTENLRKYGSRKKKYIGIIKAFSKFFYTTLKPDLYGQLLEEFEKLSNNPAEKAIFQLFDFKLLLESKMNRCNMGERMKIYR